MATSSSTGHLYINQAERSERETMSDSDLDLDEFLDTVDTEDAMMDGTHAPAAPGPENAAVHVANVHSNDVMAFGSSDQGKKQRFRSRRNSGSAASSSNSVGVAGNKNAKFPVKLHDMLTQTNLSGGIIEWRQDGTCFQILDRERLATELLPMYFVSIMICVTNYVCNFYT